MRILFLLLSLAAGVARADAYPDRPLRTLVGFPPGGGADIVARLVTEPLAERLKTQIVIDNRPGAGSATAAGVAAKATPDGYTLLFSTTSLTINPALYQNIPYDAVRDFAPVARVASSPFVLVVQASMPANTLQELIALAKARPGTLDYSTGGNGSMGHLAGELMKSMAKIDIQHVPYKGLAPALTDLLGGRVQMTLSSLPSCINYMKAGRLKAIAITTAKRLKSIATVPTMAEAGLPGYNVDQWYGLLAPAGTPPLAIRTLHRALTDTLTESNVILGERFAVLGVAPEVNTPAEFAAQIRSELPLWAKIVKESGAKVD